MAGPDGPMTRQRRDTGIPAMQEMCHGHVRPGHRVRPASNMRSLQNLASLIMKALPNRL